MPPWHPINQYGCHIINMAQLQMYCFFMMLSWFYLFFTESISSTEEHTVQSLLKLLQKTEFENLVPRFTAIVPPAWSEIQQEQQQRQHPQHLHQQSLGDATLHTRTWKLLPEAKRLGFLFA
jgi:hypothetical protein